jgi:hypothetical protein
MIVRIANRKNSKKNERKKKMMKKNRI